MHSNEKLMDEILNIRYKSPEKEKELCFELLHMSRDEYTTAFARTYLGDAFHSLGLLEGAVRECQMALEIAQKNRYEKLSLTLYNLLGIIYTHMEDEQGALDYYFKGISLAKKTQDYMMCGALLANITFVYRKYGAYDKAEVALDKAYHMSRTAVTNDTHIKFSDQFYQKQKADIYLLKKEPDQAFPLLEMAASEGESEEDPELMLLYAEYYAQKEDKENALRYLQIVSDIMEQTSNDFEKISFYFGSIEIFMTLKEFDRAQIIVQKSKNILYGMNLSAKWVKLAEYEVEISKGLNDYKKLDKAYRLFYEKDKQFDGTRKEAEIKRLKKRIELQNEVKKRADMEARQAALTVKSECDELTGIYNRRGIRKYLSPQYRQAQQQGDMVAAVIVDVDYFKEYNDTYGHLAGDECLKQIAEVLTNAVNGQGLVGRYGGDEFLIAAFARKTEEIENMILNIRQGINALAMENQNSKVSGFITVTIGAVNAVPGQNTDVSEYMHAADTALYEIKKNSKNGYYIMDSLYKEKD